MEKTDESELTTGTIPILPNKKIIDQNGKEKQSNTNNEKTQSISTSDLNSNKNAEKKVFTPI